MRDNTSLVMVICILTLAFLSLWIIDKKQTRIKALERKNKCLRGYILEQEESSLERRKIALETIYLQDEILDKFQSSRNEKRKNKQLLDNYQYLNYE